ncbi:MAG: cell division protein FtsA [Candidatus Wildermuthbacteria bacterium]|nr:cell division protein FtsA [Candidatus Wildermuthbacteria bacterium]
MKKHQIVAGLDIGTRAIKMAVAKVSQETGVLELMGVAQEASAGMRKGVVVKPEETSKKIASLARKMEQISGERISEVFLTLGGSRVCALPSHGLIAVSRADSHISQEDVDRVLQAAQAFSLSQNQEVLNVFPRQFSVDGDKGIKEPIGLRAVRLEADVLAVCVFSPDMRNLTQAVMDAGLEIADIVPAPLACAASVLDDQQKEMGVAVLDLGAGTTGISVFEEGDLVHLAVLPVGGENITFDIGIGLKTDHETAERIKIEFGTCVAPKSRKMEKITLLNGEEFVFSPKLVSDIIEARAKEIFQLFVKELKKAGLRSQLPGGVVLCGGGAKLSKIAEYAKKELKLPVRVGVPQGLLALETDPSFLPALGLLVGGEDFEGARSGSSPFGKILSSFRKMLQSFLP